MKLEVFIDALAAEWDDFVLNRAENGSFIHTRNFISYHPDGRFVDSSLLFRNSKGTLQAVIPACQITDAGRKSFFSHRGCTYGGMIFRAGLYRYSYVQDVFAILEDYLIENAYDDCTIKLPAELYCGADSALLEYEATRRGWQQFTELNTYIDFSRYPEDTLSAFSQGKRSHVHKCQREGFSFRPIELTESLDDFYALLTENLKKYKTQPVHKSLELEDFRQNRLRGLVRFFGVFKSTELVAAAMIYEYKKTGYWYTVYLPARAEPGLSPSSFLYYSMIEAARTAGMRGISFGISTEDKGRILNEQLLRSKEDYGSRHSLHRSLYTDEAKASAPKLSGRA